MQDFSISSDAITAFIMDYGPKVIGAVLTLIIGFIVIGIIVGFVNKTMLNRGVDPSLVPFLKSILSIVLKVALVLTVVGILGVEVTSFIAILGAAGLAVGLALQGTLQNFAGGVMILLFKPFRVGDVIDATGYVGSVNEIQIFNTIMKTPDNKTIIIPNGQLANASMTNYSTEPRRRVDWTIGIGYGDDVDKAKEVIRKLIDADSRILQDPEPFIAVSELADSSVNFAVRVWVESGDYWGVFFEMNENVYKTFAEVGLNIPFPQMDVHVHQN